MELGAASIAMFQLPSEAAAGHLQHPIQGRLGQGTQDVLTPDTARQIFTHAQLGQGATMASKASAVWTGSLKEGKGTISTATGVLSDANYSFQTRFEGADSGTTPEELIAAAHASCFSMALGAQLGGSGLSTTKIETHAAVTLGKVEGGFAITKIALTTTADVPGATKEVFDAAAAGAKAGCPISKLFANNTEIVLDATLV
jgi:osmotically inducible protein OsmC